VQSTPPAKPPERAVTVTLRLRQLLVAGVVVGVLVAGFGLFVAGRASVSPAAAWPGSPVAGASLAAATAAPPPYSDCSVQPGADAGHDVAVEITGDGAVDACNGLISEGWQRVLPAPGSSSVCTLEQGALTAVVWDTGGALYGTQECTADLPERGWSPG
jgi:hypothetical protein